MIDGTPLNVLIEQASQLKSAQLAESRRKFDGQLIWYRNSLYSKDVSCFFAYVCVYSLLQHLIYRLNFIERISFKLGKRKASFPRLPLLTSAVKKEMMPSV
jgi:hypothetical protein